MVRMYSKHKMFIGRIGVQASSRRFQRTICVRQEALQQVPYALDLVLAGWAPRRIRRGGLSFVVNGQFESVAQVGKSVKELLLSVLANNDGESLRAEQFRVSSWREPCQNLSFDRERQVQIL